MQMSPDLVFCPCLQSLVDLHMQMTPYPRELTLQHGSMPMASHLHSNASVNIHDPKNTQPSPECATAHLHIHEVICMRRAVEAAPRRVNIHRRICMTSHNFAWCHLHMNLCWLEAFHDGARPHLHMQIYQGGSGTQQTG